jgi:hypothetical protein
MKALLSKPAMERLAHRAYLVYHEKMGLPPVQPGWWNSLPKKVKAAWVGVVQSTLQETGYRKPSIRGSARRSTLRTWL